MQGEGAHQAVSGASPGSLDPGAFAADVLLAFDARPCGDVLGLIGGLLKGAAQRMELRGGAVMHLSASFELAGADMKMVVSPGGEARAEGGTPFGQGEVVRLKVIAVCSCLDDHGVEVAFKEELSGLPEEIFCELMDHEHAYERDPP